MNPEHTGLNANERFHRGQPGQHFFSGVADQRRQKRGGSEPAVSRGDSSNGVGRWGVVEQNVAAAVDLDVDEARRKPRVAALQFTDWDSSWDLAAWNDCGDRVAIDQYRRVLMRNDAIENMTRRDGMNACAHRVRVTFCRCRGRSISAPRNAARPTRN